MQWKQIKSLFILCFLILNVYLLFMFFNKQQELDYGVTEVQSLELQEQLEQEDITISADLPDEKPQETNITVSQKTYTDKDLEFLDGLENQQIEVIDSKLILSRFNEPVAIPENADSSLITELVKNRILSPDSYTYGTWNKEMNVLVFFQKKSDRPIYYNQNGIILIFLNDENEMTFYTQTMLGEESTPTETEDLIPPMTAIEVLFEGNMLLSGDEITKVNMGFYTRIPLGTGEQVFAPTWKITVNGNENFYVNAIENLVVSSEELTFLTEAVNSNIEKIQEKLPDDNDMKSFIINRLNQKLTTDNRSEPQ
ncbi:two-component system regulatory protein YycI [Virgibacillus doumboii]|uniref:two-component system regulatory protein YycI n=1 Tax=Virgibacillus doumboii TaxID=2697503 RepID=UPI0013DF9BD2|nr:two-component system regulatory protein YycI [Virgibacillus doumboii]